MAVETKTNAEWVYILKADTAIVMNRLDAVGLMKYITEFEPTLIIRAIINYEPNKIKLVKIP